MRIERGTARTAIISDTYTLKIARVYLRPAIKELQRYVEGRIKYGEKFNLFSGGTREIVRDCLLRGIGENVREARHSNKLGDIVVPTRFSFLGLFNVQESAQPHNLSTRDIYRALTLKTGNLLWQDPHTFTEPENYGIHGGRLKFIDYGGKNAIEVMLANRALFRHALNFLYDQKA